MYGWVRNGKLYSSHIVPEREVGRRPDEVLVIPFNDPDALVAQMAHAMKNASAGDETWQKFARAVLQSLGVKARAK